MATSTAVVFHVPGSVSGSFEGAQFFRVELAETQPSIGDCGGEPHAKAVLARAKDLSQEWRRWTLFFLRDNSSPVCLWFGGGKWHMESVLVNSPTCLGRDLRFVRVINLEPITIVV